MDLSSVEQSKYIQQNYNEDLNQKSETNKAQSSEAIPLTSGNVKNLDKGVKIERVINSLIVSDGEIGPVKQGRIGDCYLLSSLNALASTEEGAKILKDNIKRNKDGSFTITLPGAKIAAKEAKENGETSYITGSYTITTADVLKAKRSKKYSKGDDDVLLYELAFERYRREVMKTNKVNGNSEGNFAIGEYQGGATWFSPLNGGTAADSMFVLTGKKAKARYSDSSSVAAVPVHQIKTLSKEKNNKIVEGGIKKNEVNTYLDRIKREPNRYAVTISLKLDMDNGKLGYHAFQLKSVTDENVILINPWNSKKEITMSREQFMKSQYKFEVWDSKESGIMQDAIDNISDYWHWLTD